MMNNYRKNMIRIFYIILITSGLVFAQEGKLKGQITHAAEPIPGVNIFLLETANGGVSDIDGLYEIKNIPAGKHTVQFSSVGFETKIFEINVLANRTLLWNVEMISKSIEIGEVKIVDNKIQKQDDTRTSLINLQPRSAKVMPGAITDVFRSLQSLPGVLAPNDFSSQLIIRGSGPDQNLIIMDDVEVFNPYRLYGVISMFNPEAVSDINLITGGFPARYGDRLSAVLDVTNRQGNINSAISGNVNASIVAANIVLEGKNPFNIPGSWLINSRRTYYDLIIEPFVKNSGLVEDNVSFPNFYDVQTKLAFGPFNGHKFFINGIYSRDGVRVISGPKRKTADSVSVVDVSKNDLISLAWHYAPKDNLLNKVIVSWYNNGGDSNFDSELLDPSLDRNDFEDIAPDTLKPYLFGFGVKSKYKFSKYSIEDRFTYFWKENNELEFGVGFDKMSTLIDFDFDIDPELQAFLRFSVRARAALEDLKDKIDYQRFRAYVNNKFMFGKFFLQPGLRYDYYEILNKSYLAPRISLSYAFDEITTLRAVWGIYYQSIGYEKLRDRNRLFDFNENVNKNLDAEKSTHYVVSLERWLSNEWKIKFESYFKDFTDLIEPVKVIGTGYTVQAIPGRDIRYVSGWSEPIKISIDSTTSIPANNSYGQAYGFELLLEKLNLTEGGKINGWISYSLAYANRYVEGRKLPFQYDQRHTANLVLNYKINSWLELGARFQFGSGFPLTKALGIKPRITLGDKDGDLIPETPVIATRGSADAVIFDVDYGDNNNRYNSRKPDYHRLDLRLNAKADYFDFDWTFYLDVINVYNRSNIINYDYFVTDDLKLKKEATSMFPILPTIGFNVRF